MRRVVARLLLISMSVPLLAASLPAGAQATHADGSPAAAATPAQVRLPSLEEVQLAVPRTVRAATSALGLGRQRLALVVGIGSNGRRTVLDNAARDAQAVAAALRHGGFVVMLREDLGAADLRANLKEFRDRLQPDGVGFIYVAALGAQVDGENLLLPRDLPLDPAAAPAALSAQLRGGAVPVAELVDALLGPAGSPRLLVVDAAWRHAALDKLPTPGLAAQRLPAGTMALFGHGLGLVKDVPAVAPLPTPAPAAPALIAASAFAGALVDALMTPRISGPEALRAARRALVERTQGRTEPWLGGDTDASEEFAEATLLDGLVPRSPEEIGREAARQIVKLGTRSGGRGGEQTVAQVLEQTASSGNASSPAADEGPRNDETARRTVPEAPASGTGNLIGTAAAAVGTVAGVAAGVGATAAAVQVAKAAAATEVATTAVGAASALAAKAAELVAAPVAGVPTAAPPTLLPAARPAPDRRNGQRLAQAAASTLAPQQAQPEQETAAAVRSPPPAADMRTLRNPGGGERPAYVPRGNSFGYAEGDTFTYQITDTWKGEVTGQRTTAIEAVLDDGQLIANGRQLQLDPQGRVMRDIAADGSFSHFDPFQDLWWSNPQRGQSRAVKFVERFGRGNQVRGQTEWKGSTHVGRARTLETPAGAFEVLPIESSGWWTRSLANGAADESGQWRRTVWYSPRLGHPVAIDIEDADRLGQLLKRERIELLHAQTARP